MPSLALGEKVRLTARIWMWASRIRRAERRNALPRLVRRLNVRTRDPQAVYPPRALGLAINRALAPARPTCLTQSLVLFRLLTEQGAEPELVIGLPPDAPTHDAHSWVEVDGVDVGPPPGRMRHEPIARYR